MVVPVTSLMTALTTTSYLVYDHSISSESILDLELIVSSNTVSLDLVSSFSSLLATVHQTYP